MQQSAKSWHNVGLQEHNDSLISAFVSDVRESPANIVQNLCVIIFGQDLRKCGNGALNELKSCGRFSLAKIAQSPDCISYEGAISRSLFNLFTDGWKNVAVNDGVTESDVVTRDVSKAPNGLFFDLNVSLLGNN